MDDIAPELRPAEPEEHDALVRLASEHDKPSFMDRAFAEDFERSDHLLLVAVVAGELVGYGRGGYFSPAPAAPANVAPAGYYLGGLLVAGPWRRRGIALALTRARMDWAFERADEVWYFTNARNTASLALHARLGFVEVTRDFTYPDVAFAGGVGVLSRARRDTAPSVITDTATAAVRADGWAGARPAAARPHAGPGRRRGRRGPSRW